MMHFVVPGVVLDASEAESVEAVTLLLRAQSPRSLPYRSH